METIGLRRRRRRGGGDRPGGREALPFPPGTEPRTTAARRARGEGGKGTGRREEGRHRTWERVGGDARTLASLSTGRVARSTPSLKTPRPADPDPAAPAPGSAPGRPAPPRIRPRLQPRIRPRRQPRIRPRRDPRRDPRHSTPRRGAPGCRTSTTAGDKRARHHSPVQRTRAARRHPRARRPAASAATWTPFLGLLDALARDAADHSESRDYDLREPEDSPWRRSTRARSRRLTLRRKSAQRRAR